MAKVTSRGDWALSMKVTDNMTPEDAAIYARLPLVGRLMVHRDRKEARVMKSFTIGIGLVSGDAEVRQVFNAERAFFGAEGV
jgi:hypothetical protein